MANTKKMNININVTGATETEINVLKAMFGDRITISLMEKPKPENKKNAPKPEETEVVDDKDKENSGDKVKKTYKEAIDEWLEKQYGDLDTAKKVQEMTKTVAADWKKQWIETGKPVVSKKNYKTKLYAESYLRVLVANKTEKNIIDAQRKVVEGLK